MSVFKVKYLATPRVKHVYCRVFASPSPNHTYHSLGNLTLGAGEEFEAFQRAFSGAAFEDDSRESPETDRSVR